MNITKSLLIFAMAWGGCAQAAEPTPDLWAQWEREQKWQNVTLEIPGIDGQVSGVVADGKKLYIDGFDGPMQSKADLNSSLWGWFSTKAGFAKDCDMLAPAIEKARQEKNTFSLTMQAIPLKSAFYKVKYADGRSETLKGPANSFMPIEYVEVSIKPSADAMIVKTLDIKRTEAKFKAQLEAQKDSIVANGEMSLDLTTLDDLACDLLNQRVQIEVKTNIHYSAARLNRETFLKPAQVQDLYAQLQSGGDVTNAQGDDQKILAPAFLALSLPSARVAMKDFQAWEFVRLYKLLFDPVSAQLQTLGNEQLSAVAQKMDRLKPAYTWSTPAYSVNLNSEAQ